MGRLLNASLILLGLSTPALACSTTTPCPVEDGEYFIKMPENPQKPTPAIVFIHGWAASGPAMFKNTGMTDAFLKRGYAIIAPNGMSRENGRGRSWSFHPAFPSRRDEIKFLTDVRKDIIEKHNIDPGRILLSGFSIGGSMAAYFACKSPKTFTAYAPVSGNFWRPLPDKCEGPVKMLHTHGWKDGTVPLEGRLLRPAQSNGGQELAQGNIFQALDIWRVTNQCGNYKPNSYSTGKPFWRRKWTNCAEGASLEFAMFEGGHAIPKGWSTMAIDWFEAD